MTSPDIGNDKEYQKALKSLNPVINRLMQNLVADLVAKGDITEAELADSAVLIPKIKDHLARVEFNIVLDHRDTLESLARDFGRDEKDEISLLFYALFFEHTLNGIVRDTLERGKHSYDVVSSAIRSINTDGKLGWFLAVLGLKPLNKKHRLTITQVFAERNAFVHYKYPIQPDDMSTATDERRRALIAEAQKAVVYLKRYETAAKFSGKKSRIAGALKPRRKAPARGKLTIG